MLGMDAGVKERSWHPRNRCSELYGGAAARMTTPTSSALYGHSGPCSPDKSNGEELSRRKWGSKLSRFNLRNVQHTRKPEGD
jgi:hypothetical protein